MLDGLTGVLGSSEEEGVGAGWRPDGKLVEGQALTAGLYDPGAGGSGEAESCNRQLGDLEEAVVIGDGSDNDNGLVLVALAGLLAGGGGNDARDGHRRTVDAGHEQTAEHGLVERRVGTA